MPDVGPQADTYLAFGQQQQVGAADQQLQCEAPGQLKQMVAPDQQLQGIGNSAEGCVAALTRTSEPA